MTELTSYRDGPAQVVIRREGDDLLFTSSYDDNGRPAVDERRVRLADFIATGEGPWPWFDLGERRGAALGILDALGVAPPAWTEPLTPDVLDLFQRASRGDTGVIELVAMGADPDPVDPCGASPLWYGVRSHSAGIVVALIDAGADAGRRIELSARGDRFTTILHEIVRRGRTVALAHALARGVDPALTDSEGATPMHVVAADADQVNPELVRALARAGASVHAATRDGTQPIDRAARSVLPATVAALLDLGADPRRGLDALLAWWSIVGAQYNGYRAHEVGAVIEILRAGGAEVTARDRELAAGAPGVEAALRR